MIDLEKYKSLIVKNKEREQLIDKLMDMTDKEISDWAEKECPYESNESSLVHPIYGRLMRIAFRKGFKSGVEWYKRITLTGLK